jgi:hypothetical protein
MDLQEEWSMSTDILSQINQAVSKIIVAIVWVIISILGNRVVLTHIYKQNYNTNTQQLDPPQIHSSTATIFSTIGCSECIEEECLIEEINKQKTESDQLRESKDPYLRRTNQLCSICHNTK